MDNCQLREFCLILAILLIHSVRQMGMRIEENKIKLPQMETYEQSKLVNVLHAKELARQLRGTKSKCFNLVSVCCTVLLETLK